MKIYYIISMETNSMKKEIIRNYFIKNVDFTNDKWSAKSIREELKNILGEEPGIKVNYIKDVVINEVTSTAKEIKKVESVTLYFTDLDDKITTMEFLID